MLGEITEMKHMREITEMKHMWRDIKNPLHARINISKDEAQLLLLTKSVTDVRNAEKQHNRNLYGL